jgi:hypothetical protein
MIEEKPPKKKFVELPSLERFLSVQSREVYCEYREIVERLEHEGRLSMPFGEKLEKEKLFVIRVIRAGNVRVFYAYGKGDWVYGLTGYVKKSRTIPLTELRKARNVLKVIVAQGLA